MGIRLTPKEGWLSVVLLLLLHLSVAWSLQGANWAPGLGILNGVVLVALPTGMLLAKTRLPGILAHFFSLFVGIVWVIWLTFSLIPEVDGWVNKFIQLAIHIILWIQTAMGGGVSYDNLIFVLEMAALFWLVSYTSSWALFRSHNIWGVLLLPGVTILINTYYAQQGLSMLLVAFLVCAFLLIVRTYLYEQEREWRANGVVYNPDLGVDFLRDGAIFAVTIIILAWLVPAAVEQGRFSPWLARMGAPLGAAQQNWNRLFAALNYRGTAAGTWFGRTMTFQGPLRLTDELVMEVEADQGRYWRAAVFDRYNSAGWSATSGRLVEMEGQAPRLPGISQSTDELRSSVSQRFTIYNPAGTLLFAASQPLQVSVPASMYLAGPAAQLEGTTATALAQLYAAQPLYRGQVYEVTSAVSRADIASLRGSGTDYPEYIREAYTQVPETVPTRVRQLAEQVTQGLETPYDKAKAIEHYLRQLPYDETIPGPQPGQDGVDYFLFEQRSGYCDYYASSMAVMLRSLGVPARIAQGYSQGVVDSETSFFQVRQRDAHTWVEVYFPRYGWVEFEPTAAEPPLDRPETGEPNSPNAVPTPGGPAESPLDDLERLRRLEEEAQREEAANPTPGWISLSVDPRVLLPPLGAALMLGLAAWGGRFALSRRWSGLSLIERIFDQLAVGAYLLGIRQRPTQTPDEYIGAIQEQVPSAQSSLSRLARLFGRSRFGHTPLSSTEEQEAHSLWHETRMALMRRLGNRWRRDQ